MLLWRFTQFAGLNLLGIQRYLTWWLQAISIRIIAPIEIWRLKIRRARMNTVSLEDTPLLSCWSCHLTLQLSWFFCGKDSYYSSKNFDHCREWIIKRLDQIVSASRFVGILCWVSLSSRTVIWSWSGFNIEWLWGGWMLLLRSTRLFVPSPNVSRKNFSRLALAYCCLDYQTKSNQPGVL